MNRIISFLLIFISLSILISSCAPTTGASYLKKDQGSNASNLPEKVFQVTDLVDDTIHINDELYITVSTSNDEPNNFSRNSGGATNNLDLISYRVEVDGTLKLPYIQRMQIAKMTIAEATDTIESELSQYLYLPTVSIRKVNHRYSVLGEVNNPGLFTFNQKPLNIYQAIASAGDISVFGNRQNVLILRQNETEVLKKYVNLLDDDIISSEWYMVKPNDMIFVEPLKRKIFGMETFPYGLIMSVFSTTLVAITFLISIYNN